MRVVREGRARYTAPVSRFSSGRRFKIRNGRSTRKTPKTIKGPCKEGAALGESGEMSGGGATEEEKLA
jgi:hypothetical protein